MKIAELDYDLRIDELKINISYAKDIGKSLSSSRREYRKFADSINIEFVALEKSLKSYEYTVLIDAYTLSEQIVKNFYYHLLVANPSNDYVEKFINSKLPKERFSPNAKYSEIEKSIKKDLINDFSFLFKNDNDFVKSYNNLISERHLYAHTGNCTFQFDKIDEAISMIEYLYKEIENIMTKDHDYGKNFRTEIKNIMDLFSSTYTILSQYQSSSEDSRHAVKSSLMDLQNSLSLLFNDYKDMMDLSVFLKFKETANIFLNCDIDNSIDESITIFDEMKIIFDDLKLK